MAKTYVMGLDLGTTNVKAVVGDDEGRVLGSATRTYEHLHPRPGWVEVDPETWWSTSCAAIAAAIGASGVDASEVGAIGVSGLGGCAVALDREGRPVANAPLYNDVRTAPQVAAREAMADRIFESSGNPLGTWAAVPKLWWWQEQEPAVFERIHTLLEPADYVVFRLTGNRQAAAPNASISYAYRLATQSWDTDFADELGIPTHVLPPITQTGGPAGEVTGDAAHATGLPRGATVAACGNDVVALSLALGVSQPGEAFLGAGTGGNIGIVNDGQASLRGFLNLAHVLPGTSWMAGTMGACGAALQWCRDTIVREASTAAEALGAELDAFEILSAMAAKAEPAPASLIFLPYLFGRSSPAFDPHVKATFLGLTTELSRGQIAKSVMEGTAFEALSNLQLAETAGVKTTVLRAGGGPTRSDVWNQTYADVCGRPIVTMANDGDSAVGCSWMAGAAAGLWSIPECIERFVRVRREYLPDEARHARYREMAEVQDELYPHLRQAYDRLHEIEERLPPGGGA